MKVLIVDDEKMIRNWLTILLNQIPGNDIEVATANNVEDALEYCEQQDVQLVITDITMPQRNGLELLQILQETHPQINTAVLSAYDDYQYIRSAMQLGAIDYMLKSEMQLADILSVLKKVELFSSSTASVSLSQEYLPSSADYRLADYMDDTESLLTFLSKTIPSLTMDEITVSTFSFENGQDIRPPQVLDICNKTLSSEGITGHSYYEHNAFWVIYNTGHTILEHQKTIQQKISLLLERNLRMVIHQRMKDEAVNSVFDADGLWTILRQRLISLRCHQYYSVSQQDSPQFLPLSQEILGPVIKKIRFFLEMHHYSDATDTLAQFVQEAHQSRVVPPEMKVAIHHCITIIFLNSDALKDNSVFVSRYQNISQQLNSANTAESVSKLVNEFCMLCKEELQDSKKPPLPPSLKKAIDYIDKNYMCRLTLDDLSQHIYLNKNYISQLFMKHLDVSFSNYLERVRIYKAQELLLNTNLSVMKIAEEIGYTSQSYFTKAFKKHVGMSPLKFRSISLSYNSLA